jgi:hypothetical protein
MAKSEPSLWLAGCSRALGPVLIAETSNQRPLAATRLVRRQEVTMMILSVRQIDIRGLGGGYCKACSRRDPPTGPA